MERICLDLAERAPPIEAEALRDVAKNYHRDSGTAAQSDVIELSLRAVLIIAAIVYVVWTPIYLIGSAAYAPEPRPVGRLVEQLPAFVPADSGKFTARTYMFARTKTYLADPAPLVIYENLTPLPPANYELQELSAANIWRYVVLRTSDGSDPRNNGRRYYIVLP